MSSFKEREDRIVRRDEAAASAIEDERKRREAKTAKLRALRIEHEARGRKPVAEARRRRPGS